MGEKLFDDLARALVQPVPRSRALRLIGSILVATSLPGAAFARSRRPTRRTSFECKTEDGYGGQECCTGEICCGKKNCCSPGVTWCASDGTCAKCPPPLVRCGPKCCTPRSTCCKRPRGNTPAGFPGSLQYVCCKRPNTCSSGTCKCPSGKQICNGRKCCAQGEHCANCIESRYDSDTIFAGQQKCCPRGKDCCGGMCIDRVLQCCEGKPCPRSKPYCAELGGCCSEEQFAIREGVGVCCQAGTVATPSGDCCPPGQESC
jgi:hypothetical protein